MIVALSSFKSKLSTLTFVLDSSSSRFRLDCRFFSSFFPIPRCLGVVLVPYIILFSKADFLSSNLINRTRVSSLKPSKAILQWSFNLLSISLSRDVRSYWFNIMHLLDLHVLFVTTNVCLHRTITFLLQLHTPAFVNHILWSRVMVNIWSFLVSTLEWVLSP